MYIRVFELLCPVKSVGLSRCQAQGFRSGGGLRSFAALGLSMRFNLEWPLGKCREAEAKQIQNAEIAGTCAARDGNSASLSFLELADKNRKARQLQIHEVPRDLDYNPRAPNVTSKSTESVRESCQTKTAR